MLPGNIPVKRLFVQAPMAIPHWRALWHRGCSLRAACAIRDARKSLFLPVQIPFCARSSLIDLSGNPCGERIVHTVFVCALSHSPKFIPPSAKGLSTFWRRFNHSCDRPIGAVKVSRTFSPIDGCLFCMVSLAALLIRCAGAIQETVET